MKTTKLVLVGMVVLVALAVAAWSVAPLDGPTSRLSFKDRCQRSMQSCTAKVRRPSSNLCMVEDGDVLAVKAATPDSLKKPVMIPSFYFPADATEKGCTIFFTWLEDRPRLRTITVRNPETDRKITITIPQYRLDSAVEHEEDYCFIYGWIDHIPADFVAEPSQALEVSAPDQKIPATCYPSVVWDATHTSPTTLP